MERALKQYEEDMWVTDPEFRKILAASPNFREARSTVINYLGGWKRALRSGEMKIPVLQWVVIDDCVDVLRNIFSERFEKAAKFSALRTLWQLARGRLAGRYEALSPGFFEEFRHLFLGLTARSRIYQDWEVPKYLKAGGRETAQARSDALDALAERVEAGLARFPSGLDEGLAAERRHNAERIRKFFGASEEEWNDWRWQLRNVIRDRNVLRKLVELTPEEDQAVMQAGFKGVPFGISPYYLSLIRPQRSSAGIHATRAQVIPPLDYVNQMGRFKGRRSFECDFMLERDTSPVDLVTRRYPRIAILKPYNSCFQICVYCQRNWEITGVGGPAAAASFKKLQGAIDWIAAHPAIKEVLVTGGDPLVMGDERIKMILASLAAVPAIERVRIGTRAPVVAPMRFTDELIAILAGYHDPPRREIILVTHFEHAAEVTPEAAAAISKVRRAGIYSYNQAVYTFANCRRFEMCALRLALRHIGVEPYYLFNAKGKKELSTYRVPIARLQQEWKEEARLLSGIVRTEAPVYNIPRLGKTSVIAWQHHRLISILPDGRRLYEFHPWEKQIALADAFVEADVSIFDFLQELEARGENVEDYESIWYYF